MSTEKEGAMRFCRYRRCRWTGRLLDAEDYGHKVWPIGPRKRK